MSASPSRRVYAGHTQALWGQDPSNSPYKSALQPCLSENKCKYRFFPGDNVCCDFHSGLDGIGAIAPDEISLFWLDRHFMRREQIHRHHRALGVMASGAIALTTPLSVP